MPSPSEHVLILRAIAGDAVAQDELWREHRPWLATVLVAQLGLDAEVEDLLQEVAVRFVAEVRRLRDPAALRAWLRRIAQNAVCSAARSRLRRRTVGLGDADVAVPDPDEGRRAVARERLAAVLAFVARLEPEYREPLLLKTLHAWPQRRIAATLGVAETTVESRIARARRALRAAFAVPPRTGQECLARRTR